MVVESQVKGAFIIQAETEDEVQEILFSSLHCQFSKAGVWDFDMRLIAIHEED